MVKGTARDCKSIKMEVRTKVTSRKTFDTAKGDTSFLMENYTTKVIVLPVKKKDKEQSTTKMIASMKALFTMTKKVAWAYVHYPTVQSSVGCGRMTN